MTNNLELLKNHLYKLIKEELEGGEEEKQAGLEKVMFDLVLEPANLEAALTALQNSKNYGIYANGLLVETASEGYLKNRSNMELIE